jgi:transglutaminase-like putative cysteine protease
MRLVKMQNRFVHKAAILLVLLVTLISSISFAAAEEDLAAAYTITSSWNYYLTQSNAKLAKYEFDKALQTDNRNPLQWWGLAASHRALGNYGNAYRATLQALDRGRYSTLGEIYLSRAFELQSYSTQTGELTTLCESIAFDPDVNPYSKSFTRWVLYHQYRMDGNWASAEKQLNTLGFATDFRIIGPFDNEGKSGFDTEYPPETEINLDTTYKGKLVEVSWTHPALANYQGGAVSLAGLVSPSENATAYYLTYLYSSTDQWAALRLGGSALQAWVNDYQALSNPAIRQGKFDQEHLAVYLAKGWNKVLIKSGVLKGNWDIFVRVTALDGSPANGVFSSCSNEVVKNYQVFQGIKEKYAAKPEVEMDALFALEKACHDNPSLALAWADLAYEYSIRCVHDENSQENLLAVESSLQAFPQSAYFKKLYADCQPDQNQRRQMLESAYAWDSGELDCLNRLAEMDAQQGFSEKAIARVQQLVKENPAYAAAWYNLGLENRSRGWHVEAAQSFSRFTAFAPAMAGGYYQLANLPGLYLSNNDKLKLLDKSMKLDRTYLPALDQWLNLKEDAGDTTAVAAGYEIKLKLNPFDVTALYSEAKYLHARKELSAAMEKCMRGLAISPLNPDLQKEAGLILEETGKPKEARDAWLRSLKARPNDTWLTDYMSYLAPEEEKYYQPYRLTFEQATALQKPNLDISQANLLTILDQSVVRVFADGNSSQYRHEVTKILTDDGVKQMNQLTVAYTPSQQKLEIIKSRVIKPDGTVIEATDMGDSNPSSVDSRLYYDYSVRRLALKGVEKGGWVDFEYRLDDVQSNIYGEYFGDMFVFGGYEPTCQAKYVLITPAKRKFNYYQERVPGTPLIQLSEDGQTRTYAWELDNLPYVEREPMMPSYSETLPYLKISTFDTWDQLAKWYWQLIQDQFEAPADLKEKVQELTKDKKTQMEKVRALYNFTVTDIRYLGLEFGIGGYKPHKAMDIFRARYGDCKDKATLLITMLKEIGIPADIVLIRTRDLGKVDRTLPSLGLFNHAICHVPDVDGKELWLDGTAMYTSLDEFPPSDQGCEVFCVNSTRGVYKTTTTFQASQSVAEYETEIKLNGDGSAKGSRNTRLKGAFAPGMRYYFSNPAKIQQDVERQFNAILPGTRLSNIQHSDFTNLDEPSRLSFEFTVPPMTMKNGERIQVFGNLFPIGLSPNYARRSDRQSPMKFTLPLTRRNITRYQIPAGYQVESLPQSLENDYPFGKFSIQYKVVDNVIQFTEEVQIKGWELAPADYAEFRNWCSLVDRKEEEKIILKPGK